MNKLGKATELMQDVEKLNQIKAIYETTSDFLSGSFYSDFMQEVNEQIEELEKAISNLME